MRFKFEYQMAAPAEKWLQSHGFITKREFVVPWGICDLVGCTLNKRNITKRRKYGQKKPIGPQLRIMILSQIPDEEDHRSISIGKLQRIFSDFLYENRIAYELDKLQRDKFIKKTEKGELQKLNGWMPLQRKVVALELKLTRINDALHQAINNLEFADESYVGLPMEIGRHLIQSKKKNEFDGNGIGIVGISDDKCRVLLKPKTKLSTVNKTLQTHCVERFWRIYPKGS